MSDLSMCGECGGVLAAHRCVGCDTRHSIPPLAVAIRRAHMAALMEIGGDCDCDCDDCNRSAVGVLNMPVMQAIKAVLRHLAARQATEVQAPTADVLRLLGLPDICVEWVLS